MKIFTAIAFASLVGCTQPTDQSIPANSVGVTELEITEAPGALKIVGYNDAHDQLAQLTLNDEATARVLDIDVGGVKATRHIEGDDMYRDLILPTLAPSSHTNVNGFMLALMAYAPAKTALAAHHMAFHQRDMQIAPVTTAPAGEKTYWSCSYGTNLSPMTSCCEMPGRSYWWPAGNVENLNCGISPNTGHLVYGDRLCQPTAFADTYCGGAGSRGCSMCWDVMEVSSCSWYGSGSYCNGGINGYEYEPQPYDYELP